MGRGRNVLCVQVLTNGSGKQEYNSGVLFVKLGSVLKDALGDIIPVLIMKNRIDTLYFMYDVSHEGNEFVKQLQ